jgi:prepilin-type N-terminal cleavage/methylation domain-containing protein
MNKVPEKNGFSLVEVVVAIVILTFGVLALASATGFFFTQIRDADTTTDRAMAVSETVERLRAGAYDSVVSVTEAYASSRNGYKVWYTVSSTAATMRNVTIYTRGKRFENGYWNQNALDSFNIAIARNMQQR